MISYAVIELILRYNFCINIWKNNYKTLNWNKAKNLAAQNFVNIMQFSSFNKLINEVDIFDKF